MNVFYKGDKMDLFVFLDSEEAYHKWLKGDKTVPLSDVLSTFNVYTYLTKIGSEGVLLAASKQMMSEEFGNFESVEDEIIPKILREGKVQRKKIEEGKDMKKRRNSRSSNKKK
ncbi:hypothetical protein FOA43_000463 [Brettanomyces nanus]|uniref:Ribosome maturation protein SDO1/SBDS N-terminal domain-containing protein n=1 Tax=Eeniella nana TaxID=13502 RepID=A0A875RT49_EENNA|nr:uncharacterized protein FOA43_000463 [Brettanomyces nanus]QPG73157.1 hypothetical protein FOA43_000463 [Brettanomyces nanus]